MSQFAKNLGIATGLAFDTLGRLYVGDRRGTIYQVSDTGQARRGEARPQYDGLSPRLWP